MELLKTIKSLSRGRAVVAQQAHNLEVVGSTPTPATNHGAVVYRLGHLVFNQVSRVRLSAALLTIMGCQAATAEQVPRRTVRSVK